MRGTDSPQIQGHFGLATHARQTGAIAWNAFTNIATSAIAIALAAITIVVVLLTPVVLSFKGISVLPRTVNVLALLTAPVADNSRLPWVLMPLLIIFFAGELVWRERDAGLDEITDTAPVADWALFLGKFLGLTFALAAWMAVLATAGSLSQMRMGYFDLEIGLYLQILFGLQLVDYMLFAMLVFAVHAVVNQKHIGYLVSLIAYGAIAFPSVFGLEHNLLIYGSSPRWTYSDIRGFGSSLGPWLWFKLYWAAWALLLAVLARLLWVRGSERGLSSRFRLGRRRSTKATIGVAVVAVMLIATLGGFVFYNTNVLNHYRSSSDEAGQRAEYERRYQKYSDIPQPTLTGTNLRIEIYPDRREAEIRGTYTLANTGSAAIDSLHLTNVPELENGAVVIDRPATPTLQDRDLGYSVYALPKPLAPGDSMHLEFVVRIASHGFRNNGADALIFENGTYFTNRDCLPALGYQRKRELDGIEARRQQGLPRRLAVPLLDDTEARRNRVGGESIIFAAIVGTNVDQTVVAPGALRRTWIERGRRYFQYASDAPINNDYGVFSARYAPYEEQLNPSIDAGPTVAIQIFHDPRHATNLNRMVRAVRASLSHHSKRFGPYSHTYIKLIENPTLGMGVRSQAATIEYGEGFSVLSPGNQPQDIDFVFAVMAHAAAREWWGMQVVPADVQGAGLLTAGLETYSALRVMEETLGREHMERYLSSLRSGYFRPHAGPPLMRATMPLAISRQGPFALYAMQEYIGKDRIDDALRRLLDKCRSGAAPLATSNDLYRELQAVTPDSFKTLLSDLFERNTFWDLKAERAIARQTETGAWQLQLDVRVRKTIISEGVESEVPMDDWLEVGVYGEGEPYFQKQRIHSGRQTITITVPQKPVRAGVDPRHLVSDLGESDQNVKEVQINR